MPDLDHRPRGRLHQAHIAALEHTGRASDSRMEHKHRQSVACRFEESLQEGTGTQTEAQISEVTWKTVESRCQ